MDCILRWDQWIKPAFILVFFAILYLICKKVFVKLVKGRWTSDRIASKFSPELLSIFAALGVYYAADRISDCFPEGWIDHVFRPFRDVIIVLSLARGAYKMKTLFLDKPKDRAGLFLSRGLSIVILSITAFALLGIFHVSIVPLLTFGGIGAAAIGFAAKDVMSSFFAGLVLAVNRSFSVGDQILIAEKNIEGVVEEIGWSATLVRDKDRRAVYFPNVLFSQMFIINLSRRTGRRILETFHLRHSDFDKLIPILEDVRNYLLSFASVDRKAPVLVYLDAAEKYSIRFGIDVYTEAVSLADYVVVKERILEHIVSVIRKRGAQPVHPVLAAEIPFEKEASLGC